MPGLVWLYLFYHLGIPTADHGGPTRLEYFLAKASSELLGL